jgi:hypothetical protein
VPREPARPSPEVEHLAGVAAGLWREGLGLADFYARRVALAGRPLAPDAEREAWSRLRSLARLWREAERLGLARVDEAWEPRLVELVAGVEDSLLLVLLKPGDEGVPLVDLDELAAEAEALTAEAG